ncbi:unnamed protein product, partial [Ectocarpus sp. 12 AP-2014]
TAEKNAGVAGWRENFFGSNGSWSRSRSVQVRNMLHYYYGLMLHDEIKSGAAIATA